MDFLATPGRRRVLFTMLYLSEGAPIGFLWLALPTWLRVRDVPLATITWLTAVLVIPWTFKFAWAPLVDLLRGRRFSLRHFIIVAQFFMGATLAPLAWLDLLEDFNLVASLLVAHALAAATQDVAIDALCISTTDALERGKLNGFMQAGMLSGRAMFGGGALVLAAMLGQAPVVGMLVVVTSGSAVMVALSRLPENAAGEGAGRAALFGDLLDVLSRRSTWAGLAFAFLGGAAFKSLEVVIGPFLVDRGYTEAEIGSFTAGPMIGLMILGALVGGYLADRLPRLRFVGISLVAFVAPIVALAASDLAMAGERGVHLLVCLAATAIGIGLFTAASYAMFMDLTSPRVAATQFSAFMGATNGCESWSTYAIGLIATAYGYPAGFFVMCGVSLATLPLLRFMRPDRDTG